LTNQVLQTGTPIQYIKVKRNMDPKALKIFELPAGFADRALPKIPVGWFRRKAVQQINDTILQQHYEFTQPAIRKVFEWLYVQDVNATVSRSDRIDALMAELRAVLPTPGNQMNFANVSLSRMDAPLRALTQMSHEFFSALEPKISEAFGNFNHLMSDFVRQPWVINKEEMPKVCLVLLLYMYSLLVVDGTVAWLFAHANVAPKTVCPVCKSRESVGSVDFVGRGCLWH
jgi:hypothetical protein